MPLIPIVLVALPVLAALGFVYTKRNKIKRRTKWLVALASLALSLFEAVLFEVAIALFRGRLDLAMLSVLGLLLIIFAVFCAGRYYQYRKH